jgi:hypothetical protein
VFDSVMCAVCIVVLIAWVQDYRRDKRARRRWELRAGQTLEEELEKRRRVLDRINRRGSGPPELRADIASSRGFSS